MESVAEVEQIDNGFGGLIFLGERGGLGLGDDGEDVLELGIGLLEKVVDFFGWDLT